MFINQGIEGSIKGAFYTRLEGHPHIMVLIIGNRKTNMAVQNYRTFLFLLLVFHL